MAIDNYHNPTLPVRMDSLYYKQINQQEIDHTPVAINLEDEAYTTGLNTTDNFRKRNTRKINYNSDYDSDVDLISYKSDKMHHRKQEAVKSSRKRDWYIVIALTLWAAYIRLYKIYQPASVV